MGVRLKTRSRIEDIVEVNDGHTISSNVQQDTDRVDRMMSDKRVKDAIPNRNDPEDRRAIKRQAEQAAECPVMEHSDESDETLVTTLCGLLSHLLAEKVDVFFSYKDKDRLIASQIGKKLESWSDGKLRIKHMAD